MIQKIARGFVKRTQFKKLQREQQQKLAALIRFKKIVRGFVKRTQFKQQQQQQQINLKKLQRLRNNAARKFKELKKSVLINKLLKTI